MSGTKRRPTSELNHENWNQEDEPEDGGTFTKAPEDEITKRKILRPKRKLNSNQAAASANPFSSMSFGFGSPITVSSIPPVQALADSVSSVNSSPAISEGITNQSLSEETRNEADSSTSTQLNHNEVLSRVVVDVDDDCVNSPSSSNAHIFPLGMPGVY